VLRGSAGASGAVVCRSAALFGPVLVGDDGCAYHLRAAVTGIEKESGAVRKHAAELEPGIRRVVTDLTALMAA
jgi:hypothetical protein